MTGATLERKIIGPTGGTCTTVEAMPGKRQMQCDYPADMRKAVAVFFRQMQAAEAGGKTVGGALTGKADGTSTSTTTIAGKPVVTPLQQALEDGICRISG